MTVTNALMAGSTASSCASAASVASTGEISRFRIRCASSTAGIQFNSSVIVSSALDIGLGQPQGQPVAEQGRFGTTLDLEGAVEADEVTVAARLDGRHRALRRGAAHPARTDPPNRTSSRP